MHPVYSRSVVVRNIDIKNPHDSPNTDGVDPESSQDVLIENFTYEGGDDVIAIKSGWGPPDRAHPARAEPEGERAAAGYRAPEQPTGTARRYNLISGAFN